MDFGKINENVYECFTVTDINGNRISGLTNNDFIVTLFGPDDVLTNNVTISEIASGHYRAMFVPDKIGDYFIAIYHNEYFPWGKTGNIAVYNDDFNSIGNTQKTLLGLMHENIFIDSTVFDEFNNLVKARVRIYSDSSSVGTDENIIGTYNMSCNSNGPGKFKMWKQIKE